MIPLVVPLVCAGSVALAFVHKIQSVLDEAKENTVLDSTEKTTAGVKM